MLAVNYSWEQRKLGDIFEEYSEKGHPELPALTIIQGGGTIRRTIWTSTWRKQCWIFEDKEERPYLVCTESSSRQCQCEFSL